MPLSRRAFYVLFLIIIIEGYVVLSSELLAMRITIPFIGTGTDVVSIIIAAVLLPLSFGYYFGGQFKPYTNILGKQVSVRDKLAGNILLSLCLLAIGISYVPLMFIMERLIDYGVTQRLILAGLYSAVFLAVPVYLLGQTIPLVSNYFSTEKLSQITGKILFFSTIGSFLGATFSTLVLMATIGVHYTAALNFILLGILYFIVGKRKGLAPKAFVSLLVLAGILFNCGPLLERFNVVNNNQYNVIRIFGSPESDVKVLSLNHNSDSLYSPSTNRKHEYANFIENRYIYSRALDEKPLNILILGAGGFTIGVDDTVNTYHYVDIDPDLKDVAEEHFLGKELESNKKFHPVAAETFLINGDEKFDLIILDAFQGDLTLPENLVTREFFQRVKSRLADGGIVLSNFITNPAFGDAFSRNLDYTFRSVFPLVSKEVIGNYNGWDRSRFENTVYTYYHSEDEGNVTVYTDNKNTVYYDKPRNNTARY